MIQADLLVVGLTAASPPEAPDSIAADSVDLQIAQACLNAPAAAGPDTGSTIGPAVTFSYIAPRYAATEAAG